MRSCSSPPRPSRMTRPAIASRCAQPSVPCTACSRNPPRHPCLRMHDACPFTIVLQTCPRTPQPRWCHVSAYIIVGGHAVLSASACDMRSPSNHVRVVLIASNAIPAYFPGGVPAAAMISDPFFVSSCRNRGACARMVSCTTEIQCLASSSATETGLPACTPAGVGLRNGARLRTTSALSVSLAGCTDAGAAMASIRDCASLEADCRFCPLLCKHGSLDEEQQRKQRHQEARQIPALKNP